jgi:hypothetical protein
MTATIVENTVHVKLSTRNLRDLQAILDDKDLPGRSLRRIGENGVFLVVEVEDDAKHYEGHKPGPSVRRAA